jgi:hypothetical protein
LPWIRLDTAFPDHPKVLELVADKAFQAAFAHTCAMSYSGKHGTNGYIPKSALPFIHARKVDADRLVNVGLWDPAVGGWQIHGWDEKQVSDDEAKARSEKARKAAQKRWGTA